MGVHLGGLNGGEVVVELALLGWGHFYTDGGNSRQELVQGVELLAQCAEVIIQCYAPILSISGTYKKMCTQFLDFGYTLNYNVNIIICKKSTLWGA